MCNGFDAKEELSRARIIIYQYLMFKGDRLHQEALDAVDKLKRSKYLTTDDVTTIYKTLLRDEMFEEFQTELGKLLDL